MASETTFLLLPGSSGSDNEGDIQSEGLSGKCNNCPQQFRRRSFSIWAAVLLVVVIVLLELLLIIPRKTSPSYCYSNVLNDLHPSNATFRQVAQRMVPAAYKDMYESLPALLPGNEKALRPGQVHDTRKILLRTRDILDMFAPVYPIYERHKNHTTKDDDDADLWLTLRNWTGELYKKVGDFQDFKYAKHASHHIRNHRRRKVQDLVRAFYQLDVIDSQIMLHYLSAPTQGCYPRPKHTSHLSYLYTNGAEGLPSGRDLAQPSLRGLAQQQVHHALDFLHETLSYDGLTNDTVHDTFHNLRKEMRSLTDEYDLFASTNNGPMQYIMFPRAADEAIPLLKQAHIVLGVLNDNYVAAKIYWKQSQKNETLSSDARIQQEMLAVQIKEGWKSFTDWVESVQLEQCLKDLGNLLATTASDPMGN